MPVYRLIFNPLVVQADDLRKARDAARVWMFENIGDRAQLTNTWEGPDDYIQDTGGNIDLVVETDEPEPAV